MAFSDYSSTPSANTTIAGQNIAPGGPPSAVGPGLRQIMADGKALADLVQSVPANATVADFKAAAARLSAAGGGVLNIPRGSYSFASADLTAAILLDSNIAVEGNGSSITVTGGTTIASIFRSVNASNVTIRNLLAIGNNLAVVDGTSGAFFNYVHDASGGGAENIRMDNVRLQNFQAERWISVVNTNASGKAIRGVRLNNVSGISQAGNNLGGASVGIGSSVIMVYGATAPIIDVQIDGFYAEADNIKCGITIFHAVQGVAINKPYIINAGRVGTSDDKGAYAINIYGDTGELNDVTISQPIITGPRSCGIYLRGAKRVEINKPQISGQTDVNSGTLPKGAVAVNGGSDVTVNGGLLSGNMFDVMIVADTSTTVFNHALRGVRTLGASNCSVTVNPAVGSGSPDGLTIANCDIDSAGIGVQIFNNQASSGRSMKSLSIEGGRIVARSGSGISLNPNGGAVLTAYRIANVYVGATNRGIDADMATGDLTISNVIIEDASTSALTYGLIARSFPQMHVSGLLIRNMGTGFATLTDGANGTIENLRLLNVVNGCSPNSLGMVTPTLTGTQGWFVQKLNPVEAGTAGSKYVNSGWRYTTAWLEQRTVTGN